MGDTLAALGDLHVHRSFTVTAENVRDFVELSGDDYEAHTDPEFMARSSYGQPIAHGALLVGYMSAVGTMAIRAAQAIGNRDVPVSLGYDRVRFVAPVFFGETVTAHYTISNIDQERRRTVATISVVNQDGITVAVAEHVMKWMHTDAQEGG